MAKQFRIACSGALSRVDTFIESSSTNQSDASLKHNAQLEICSATVCLSSGVSRPSAHSIKASMLRCRINYSSYLLTSRKKTAGKYHQLTGLESFFFFKQKTAY